jgi:hypothetical protein
MQKEKTRRYVEFLLLFLMIVVGVIVFVVALIAIQERSKMQEIYWQTLSLDSQSSGSYAPGESPINANLPKSGTGDQHPGQKANAHLRPFEEWWEQWIPTLLLTLVFLLLLIPALWIVYFHDLWRRGPLIGREDYLAWVTAIGVPYLILGFAMLVEFHAFIEDRRVGIGAIAAIMILYALSVLASFLYIEVRELKKSFKEDVAAASRWFSLSLKLAEAEAGQRSPAASVTNLLEAWKDLYAVESAREDLPLIRRNLRRNVIGTLLSTYAQEEVNDVRGALSADKVPESVWPWPKALLTPNRQQDGISFLTSNTTYYANFLQEALQYLPSAVKEHSGVYLATITYAPPPLWWNWLTSERPSERIGYIYSPIDEYRRTLVNVAGSSGSIGRATVLRKVILTDKTWSSDKLLTLDDWEQMKGWKLLKMQGTGKVLRSDQRALPPEYQGHCIRELKWATDKKWTDSEGHTTVRHAYWIVDSSTPPLDEITLENVNDSFASMMHPHGRGATEIHPIPEAVFNDPLIGANSDHTGLNRCSEMLFIGVKESNTSPDATIWKEANPHLALAMLTTMSPNSETMFMTIVWGEMRLKELWEGARNATARFPKAETTLTG